MRDAPFLLASQATADSRLVVLFRLSARLLALPAEAVREVLPRPEMIRPPRRPPVIEGMFDRRGSMVTVLRTERLLDLPDEPDGLYDPILLLAGPQPVGLLVRHVPDLVGLAADAVQSMPDAATLGGCAAAGFRWRDESGVLLAAERLLTAGERQALNDFQGLAERCLDSWRTDGD